jgi:sugar O-acyltransferase (sialic acid O-acetyltransferase NeuD family)
MTEGIIILGTGGTCVDILEIIEDIRKGSPLPPCIGFLDEPGAHLPASIEGLPVLGEPADARRFPEALFVNGTGSPNSYWYRDETTARTGVPAERFATLIHPSATVSHRARIGRGVVVFPGAVIHSNTVIADHVLILSNAIVNHDCHVDSHTIIAAGAQLTGGVHLEPSVYVGANATVLGGLRIGKSALVGAGAVVCHPVADRQVVTGAPARFLRSAC